MRNIRFSTWLFLPGLLLLFSCNVRDYNKVDLYSDLHRVQAVIEIPAGTSHYIEYCRLTHRFDLLMDNQDLNAQRVLPFPFNIGFIPSTLQMQHPGQTGNAIDVLIISEALQTGEIIEILPIGMVNIKEEFTTIQWIVAVPFKHVYRAVTIKSLEELKSQYSGIINIIEEWLCYSDPSGNTEIISWQDEIMALKFIQAMAIN